MTTKTEIITAIEAAADAHSTTDGEKAVRVAVGAPGHTVTFSNDPPGTPPHSTGSAWADPSTMDAVIKGVADAIDAHEGGGGGTPSDTVENETTWGITPNAGTSSEYSRGDHTHGTPADPGGGLTPATTVTDETAWGITPDVGDSLNYAREDHTHGSPAAPDTHARQHSITSSDDHTGDGDAEGYVLIGDENGLPIKGTDTDTKVHDAVQAKHSNSNDPTTDQKNALAGTSGTPSADNKYVTDADTRMDDARTPTSHGNEAHDFTAEDQANKGAASGYASLTAGSLVVQDPANATATPTAGKIVKADAYKTVNLWVPGYSPYDTADGTEIWNWDGNSVAGWYTSYNWDGDGVHDHNPGGEPWTPGTPVDFNATAAVASSILDVSTRSDECLMQPCISPMLACCMYRDISASVTFNNEWTMVARGNFATTFYGGANYNLFYVLLSLPDFTQAGKELYYNSLSLGFVTAAGASGVGFNLQSWNAGSVTTVTSGGINPNALGGFDWFMHAYHPAASASTYYKLSKDGGRSFYNIKWTAKNPTGFTHLTLASSCTITANDVYPVNGIRYVRFYSGKVFK